MKLVRLKAINLSFGINDKPFIECHLSIENVAVYLVGQQKCKRKQGWKKGGMAPLPKKLNEKPKNGKKNAKF